MIVTCIQEVVKYMSICLNKINIIFGLDFIPIHIHTVKHYITKAKLQLKRSDNSEDNHFIQSWTNVCIESKTDTK